VPARTVRLADDHGAAVIEFVMMIVLLVMVLFGVLQVAVYCYARNIVAAAAADGARYAASLGVDPAQGAARASALIADGLNAQDAALIPCTARRGEDPVSHLPVTTVHCRGRLRALLAAADLPVTIDVTASSLTELAPGAAP
jgi:Flp pilus assembly protein TadG